MDAIKNAAQINYVTVILGIFSFLFALKEFLELVSFFKKKYRIRTGEDIERETIENRISKLESHDKWQYDELFKISKCVEDIKDSLDKREIKDRAKTVATLRTQLYDLHGKFVERGYVDKSGLKTFTELGNIYEAAGGNDIYHDKLKPEVIALPIKEVNES